MILGVDAPCRTAAAFLTRRNARPPAVLVSAYAKPTRAQHRNTLSPHLNKDRRDAREAHRAAQRTNGTLPPPTNHTDLPALGQSTRGKSTWPPHTLSPPSRRLHTTPTNLSIALDISQEAAAKLLTAAPVLQEVPAEQLHEGLVYLVLLLGAPKEAILRLARLNPDALTMPQSAKQADKLGFLCYLQQRSRLLNALTHPDFLRTCRPNCFLHQVCHISACLDVTLEATIDMMVACPSLVALTQPPDRLPALAGRLAAALDLQDPDCLRSCLVQAPNLLMEAAAGGADWAQLLERAAWLRRNGLLGRPVAAVPRLLQLGVPELDAAVQQLKALLHLPLAEAVKLSARMPLLLLTSRQTLAGRLASLEQLLELPPAAARQLVVAVPRLLTDRAGATHSCLLLLRQALSLEGEHLQVLVASAPHLLARPSQLRGNCLALVHAVTTCSRWRAEVARMPLSSLPWVLQQPELHTRRLLYLLRTHRSRTTSLVGALAMPDAEFRAAYPGYGRWLSGRLPPLKLTRQQAVAFRAFVRSLPLYPDPQQLPRGRGRQQQQQQQQQQGTAADAAGEQGLYY